MYGLQRTVIGAAGGQPPEWMQIDEFYCWSDAKEKPKPPSEAGAALIELANINLLPGFVVDGEWINDLMRQGKDVKPPSRLCWAAEDAILLAPYRADPLHWGGFFVACQSARGQVREFADENGNTVSLLIPEAAIPGEALKTAKANILLPITSGKTKAENHLIFHADQHKH